MAKKKPKNTFIEIDYDTQAEPRERTPDRVPVFCAHDDIISLEQAVSPDYHTPEQNNPDESTYD